MATGVAMQTSYRSPVNDGREARFRPKMAHYKRSDEEDLLLAALAELGEVYEEDEERYVQACSREGAKHENS
jgi:hypothetical protein